MLEQLSNQVAYKKIEKIDNNSPQLELKWQVHCTVMFFRSSEREVVGVVNYPVSKIYLKELLSSNLPNHSIDLVV